MSNQLKNYIENSAAQMRKGNLELSVLAVIAKGESYASDILDQLKKYNLLIVEGTLYPLLSRLKDAGLLSYSWIESRDGPPRKYYRLTTLGEEALKIIKTNWLELNESINKII